MFVIFLGCDALLQGTLLHGLPSADLIRAHKDSSQMERLSTRVAPETRNI